MNLTKKDKKILICLIENEIDSNESFLNDVKGKEKEFWKNQILELKDILIQLKPMEIIICESQDAQELNKNFGVTE